MSAILLLGEANHVILNADAEIGLAIRKVDAAESADQKAALARAKTHLATARASLAAVRLAIGTQAVADLRRWHEQMAISLREGAFLQRVAPGHGLHVEADRHEKFAKALGDLTGLTQ